MESKEYKQGREAYSDERTLNDNPYSPGTGEYSDWQAGYEWAEKNDPLTDLLNG